MSKYNRGSVVVGLLMGLLSEITLVSALAAERQGHLQWHQKVVLSTPLSGVITQVNYRVGATVNKADVLVQLDARLLAATLAQAQATLEHAQQLHQEAQRELERMVELYERTLLSDHDKQVAQIQYAAATVALKTAQTGLVKAQLDLEYSEIRAPFAGIIVKQYVQVGETVVNRQLVQPLVELAANDIMAVMIAIPRQDLKKLSMTSKMNVKVGQKIYPATVEMIAVEPTAAANAKYNVTVIFSSQDDGLRVGEIATVSAP